MIIIDEAHTILTSLTYRTQMRQMHAALMPRVPCTLLTATLPTRLEEALKKTLSLPQTTVTIRAPTCRPEHQYIVWDIKNPNLLDTISNLIMSSSTFVAGSRRAIAFVRSKKEGHDLQNRFDGVGFINGDVKDNDERSRILQEWKAGGSGGWIIGTTSLIQGVDYEDVRLVVFVGSPYGMIDFVQGAGRAGRNGQPSKIIILHNGDPYSNPDDTEDFGCRAELVEFYKEKQRCRRFGISKCMDKVAKTCLDTAGAISCDVCGGWDEDLKVLKSAIHRHYIPGIVPLPALEPPSRPSTYTDDSPMLIKTAPLVPRAAGKQVLQRNLSETTRKAAVLETAEKSFANLLRLGNICATCHVTQGEAKSKAGVKHKTFKECWSPRPFPKHWLRFYDYNKPQKHGKPVRHYCSSTLPTTHPVFSTPRWGGPTMIELSRTGVGGVQFQILCFKRRASNTWRMDVSGLTPSCRWHGRLGIILSFSMRWHQSSNVMLPS